MIDTYEDTVAQAKAALKISDADFVKVGVEESQRVVTQIKQTFVEDHHWHWWWEHLSQTDFVVRHTADTAFLCLSQILPEPEAKVWFIVEPHGEKRQFSLYEARAKYIQPLLAESTFFEYCVVAKDLTWLLGENHHGSFFCVGEPITTRLKAIVKQNPEQWLKASPQL